MNLVTKQMLSRRTFLRGVGVSLALPLLDAMVPAFASPRLRAAVQPPRRFGAVYVPNGILMRNWTPAGEGAAVNFTRILSPLEPFRKQVIVVSGLEAKQADAYPGEGNGDHSRASAAFLTGVHPKKTDGPDMRAGTSIDQIVANELGNATQLPSLEMGLDSKEIVGSCDPGYACAYGRTISWRTP